jgi:hypothetical protein
MNATFLLPVLLLANISAAHAALGGVPEQFNGEGTTVISSVSSAASGYLTHDTSLATGTQVREYISTQGIVFALTWEGPILPDLKSLLGKHFRTMVEESTRLPRAGRSSIDINRPEVIINSGGHMRAFKGSAWIPAEFPRGFTSDDVR